MVYQEKLHPNAFWLHWLYCKARLWSLMGPICLSETPWRLNAWWHTCVFLGRRKRSRDVASLKGESGSILAAAGVICDHRILVWEKAIMAEWPHKGGCITWVQETFPFGRNSVACEDHFAELCYKENWQGKLSGSLAMKKLKFDAVLAKCQHISTAPKVRVDVKICWNHRIRKGYTNNELFFSFNAALLRPPFMLLDWLRLRGGVRVSMCVCGCVSVGFGDSVGQLYRPIQ